MSPEFTSAISTAVTIYQGGYGANFVAVYVSGSVHRDEALLGVLDLDMCSWIRKTPPPDAAPHPERLARERLAAWALDGLKAARTLQCRDGAHRSLGRRASTSLPALGPPNCGHVPLLATSSPLAGFSRVGPVSPMLNHRAPRWRGKSERPCVDAGTFPWYITGISSRPLAPSWAIVQDDRALAQ